MSPLPSFSLWPSNSLFSRFGGCSVWEVVSPSDYFLHTERYQGWFAQIELCHVCLHIIYLHRAEGSSEKDYFFVLEEMCFSVSCSVEDSVQVATATHLTYLPIQLRRTVYAIDHLHCTPPYLS
jgi:hypothetical protein